MMYTTAIASILENVVCPLRKAR